MAWLLLLAAMLQQQRMVQTAGLYAGGHLSFPHPPPAPAPSPLWASAQGPSFSSSPRSWTGRCMVDSVEPSSRIAAGINRRVPSM